MTDASKRHSIDALEKAWQAANAATDEEWDGAMIDASEAFMEQWPSVYEQLERAEKFIAHQAMEYRFAEWCGGTSAKSPTPTPWDEGEFNRNREAVRRAGFNPASREDA